MKSFIKVMKAISDPNRVKIVKLLQQKMMCVCELQGALGISQPSVSKHLKVLENAGLIQRHKEGRVHRFTVNPAPLQSAQSWIDHYQRFWTQQLESLGDYLEQTTSTEEGK